MSRPSINQVAAAAGVHRSTVSRAFSQPDLVNPVTRTHILAVAEGLGYTMSPLAQALRTKTSNLVALIAPDITNPFFAELARTMTLAARARGYQLLLCITDGDVAETERYLQAMQAMYSPFGVIAPSTSFDLDRLKKYEFWRRVVVVDSLDGETDTPTVTVDNAKGIALAFAHLRGLGHTRIGYVSGISGTVTSRSRLEEYRRLAARSGMEPIVFSGGDIEACANAAKEYVGMKERPTALISSNDMVAFALLSAFNSLGISVPEDVSLVGFDGLKLGERFSPALTTIRQPISDMGDIAINLAQQLTERGEVAHVVLEPELLVRQSTRRI